MLEGLFLIQKQVIIDVPKLLSELDNSAKYPYAEWLINNQDRYETLSLGAWSKLQQGLNVEMAKKILET
jgi:hypothetical protein